jgi:cellobiose phosphorylase
MGYTTIIGRQAGHPQAASAILCRWARPGNLAADGDQPAPAPPASRLFSLVEFCLWDALDDATNFQRNFSTGEVEVEDGVIYHKTEYRERRDHFAYFACSAPLAGFDTQREAFLGPYRGWDKPAGGRARPGDQLHRPRLGSRLARTMSNSSWPPGESAHDHLPAGLPREPGDQKFDPPGSQTHQQAQRAPVIARATWTRKWWSRLSTAARLLGRPAGRYQVHTPDEHTNRMVNIWNAYQCMVTFNMSRSASYFESGIGRGMGFRDSNQDLLGFVHMVPERARQRILDLAATQLDSAARLPPVPAADQARQRRCRQQLQRRPALAGAGRGAYIKETGDWSILDEPVPLRQPPGSEQPLYEHLQRASATRSTAWARTACR